MRNMNLPWSGGIALLCLVGILGVKAISSFMADTPDYDAMLTCGDGTQFQYSLPASRGDSIWPAMMDSSDWKMVSDVKSYTGSDMYVSQYRCLKNAVIGVGFLGYFVYDNSTKTCYLTSDYDKWCRTLHELTISPTTTMYPTPILRYYKARGWLGYQKAVE